VDLKIKSIDLSFETIPEIVALKVKKLLARSFDPLFTKFFDTKFGHIIEGFGNGCTPTKAIQFHILFTSGCCSPPSATVQSWGRCCGMTTLGIMAKILMAISPMVITWGGSLELGFDQLSVTPFPMRKLANFPGADR
jgi:hypothetical protein